MNRKGLDSEFDSEVC